MLDLRAQLESSDRKVAAKDLQISELLDLIDEQYTDGCASQCPSQLSKGQITRPMSITAIKVSDCLKMHGLSRNPTGIVLCKLNRLKIRGLLMRHHERSIPLGLV